MKQQNRHKIASLQVRKQKARAAILNELESLKVLLDDDSLSLEEYTKAEQQLKEPKAATNPLPVQNSQPSLATLKPETESQAVPQRPVNQARHSNQAQEPKNPSRVSKRRQKIRAQQAAKINQQLNMPSANNSISPGISQGIDPDNPQQELLPILNHVVDEKPKAAPEQPKRDGALIKSGSTIFLPKSAADQLENIRTQTRNQLLQQAGSNFPTETTKEAIEQEQSLKSQSNILVQDMVDEFIPVIEDVLRRRLQKEMDDYVYELIEEYQAEAELD